jgi:hypothetical protein
MRALSQSFSILRKRSRPRLRNKTKIALGFFKRDFLPRIVQTTSGFGFLPVRRLLALRFQLSELLCGKNSFRLFEECLPALFCATRLHAIGLPCFDLSLLIGREIQCCQINAGH